MVLLSMHGIEKSFAGTKALAAANLEIDAGEVMALIGQNGAGKSTLMKILTGVYKRDAGLVEFLGRQADYASPADSQTGGIATIYQEINLAPQRSVAENIFLAREPRRWGFLDKHRMRSQALEILKTFLLDIDVDRPVGEFSAATRQMVAIARAITQNAKLVIMDEPTSSLDEREVAVLFKTIRSLKTRGVSVCFIGHRLDELYAICDRVTIMRDGRTVRTGKMSEISRFELVRHMLGKELAELEQLVSAQHESESSRKLLSLQHVQCGSRVKDVTMDIHTGEIVGLAGLLGSGRSETARVIFGADTLEGGSIRFDGTECRYREPADAIRDGIGLVTEDRNVDGIVPDMSICENMTLALLPKLAKASFIDQQKQKEIALHFIKALGIKCSGPDQAISELSGGNKQKVLLARWLCTNPKFLIVDEPTRGIDIGAKTEILKLLRRLADDGLSVLMVSSEIEELLAVSDSVTVMSDGRSVASLSRSNLSERSIMSAMAHDGGGH